MNETSNLVRRRGWAVPRNDTKGLPQTLKEVAGLKKALLLFEGRRTVIQAGGNIGIWPTELAKHFARCITIEPETLNFEALRINVGNLANVTVINAAFGSEIGAGHLTYLADNIRGHHLSAGGVAVQVLTIDSLNILDCDFLQLDVEGSEFDALLGAKETIQTSHPAIMVELRGLGKQFGHSDKDTVALLESWGYRRASAWLRDVIFL